MHEVIQQVILAEDEAKRIVEAAHAQGAQIILTAQKQAQDLIASEQAALLAEVNEIIELEIHRAERERQELLVRAEKEINTQVQLQDASREQGIEAAVRCLCGL